jgi:WD40 repeat protein
MVLGLSNHTYVWDTATHKLLHKLPNYYEVSAVQFSHDDKYLIVAGENDRVSIWNVEKGFEFHKQLEGKALGFKEKLFPKSTYGHTVYDITFSIEDDYLAITFEDKPAQIYDVKRDFKMIKRFESKKDHIYDFHFSNDKKYLISSSNKIEMEFFEPFPPFKKLKTISKKDDDEVYMTAISRNSHYYLSSWDYYGYIKVWSIKDKVEQIATLDGHKKYTTELQFYNDDKYIISAGGDNKIKVWEFGTWNQLVEITLDEKHKFKISRDNLNI